MGGKEIIQNISTQSHLMEQHLWTSTLLFFYFNWDRINFSHPQESRAWEDKCQHSSFFYPSLTSWAWCHMGWDILHLPNPCSPPVSSLERCKRPWHCNHCSAITKISLCYQTCLFSVQFPKLQLDIVKKINSTPAKNSTGDLLGFTCPKGRDFFPLLCTFSQF